MSVTLVKGQEISLKQSGNGGGGGVVMGLGWDVRKSGGFLGIGKKKRDVDLDASCVMFNERKQFVDVVWLRQLQSRDGSVRHTGDNRTGAGDGDDEQILVDLRKVDASITSLFLVINSFTGETFADIADAYCRIVDGTSDQEIARFELAASGPHTAQIMAKVFRRGHDWFLHALGQTATGRTFDDLLPTMLPHL